MLRDSLSAAWTEVMQPPRRPFPSTPAWTCMETQDGSVVQNTALKPDGPGAASISSMFAQLPDLAGWLNPSHAPASLAAAL